MEYVQHGVRAFHTTTEPGYTEDEIRPLVAKWKTLLGEDLSPRVVTATALILENFSRLSEQQLDAHSDPEYYQPLARRAFAAMVAHRMFKVQVARAPVVSVTHRGETMPLVANPRELRLRLPSLTTLEDVRAFHGIDVEAEVLAAAALQLVLEFDRYHIHEVMRAAPEVIGSPCDAPAALLRQVVSWFRTQRPGEVSPDASFFAVMSPEQVVRLNVAGSGFVDRSGPAHQTLSVVGTLACDGATVDVYKDVFFPPDTIFAGWRNGPDDAGAIWAPYRLFYRPEAERPWGLQVWGGGRPPEFATRDAFRVMEPSFFAKIRVPRP